MALLNQCNFKASSITETVIAMSIIATCLTIAIITYSRVLQTDHNIAFYKSQQKVKELLLETKIKKRIENIDYNFESFKVQKRVEELDSDSSFKIVFVVTTHNSKKKYQYIVNY
ncbi:hypothetical protein N7U66_03305 [Lacinutrix neustonica]|uniref:Uncharacterized protein n=1 Tax=Lacinutrix neustonica TaxID=2980107 RepID=A0A9E8MWN9_9FLAO|nr:hypothetical protein [Lacinutrix neustonica]WAC02711.1 hypothetical protein N7U66_03305 [Lacinutrix neustonica]